MFSVYYFAELLNRIAESLSEQGYNLVLFYHDVSNILNKSTVSSGNTKVSPYGNTEVLAGNTKDSPENIKTPPGNTDSSLGSTSSFQISNSNKSFIFPEEIIQDILQVVRLMAVYYWAPTIMIRNY